MRRRGVARVLSRPTAASLIALGVVVTGLLNGWCTGAATAETSASPVVFILDASGSMVRETATGASRMDVAKRATIDTIDALADQTRVGLLVFGTGTGNSEADQVAGCSDVTTLSPLAPVDTSQLSQKIASITPSGFTPIGAALRQAAALLPAGEPSNIVLVSDGVDTCSPPSSCEVASEVHRDNPLISINVVGFGVDQDEQAQQQMTCIGGVGGGTAVSASNPTQLTTRLKAASTTSSSPSTLGIRGSHGVALGMTLDEVRAAVDGAKVGDPENRSGVQIVYVDCGWGRVELHDGRVYSITPDDPATGTAEGISAGTTRADVEAVYGAPVAGDADTSDAVVYQVQAGSSAGYRVVYDTSTGTVKYVVLCRCVASSVLSTSVSSWEVDFDGVGPLRLGMSLSAAKAAVSLTADSTDSYTAGGADAPLDLRFRDGVLASIVFQTAYQKANGALLPTSRGIRLGERAGTVVNVFPGGTYRSYEVAGTVDYLVTSRSGHLITFTVGARKSATRAEEFAAGALDSVRVEDAGVTLSAAARREAFGG